MCGLDWLAGHLGARRASARARARERERMQAAGQPGGGERETSARTGDIGRDMRQRMCVRVFF